jgi:transcriptional regulator with XRE-family HTH domain
MESLADYIRNRRLALGWTQEDLAAQAGLTQPNISDIERMQTKLPSPEARRGLARALRVRHVDLLVAAGELAPDEVPGPTQTAPASDPTRDRLEHLLAQFDLAVFGAAPARENYLAAAEAIEKLGILLAADPTHARSVLLRLRARVRLRSIGIVGIVWPPEIAPFFDAAM